MIKITTLTEDYIPQGQELIGEHGLSFFIEADGKGFLFDTGQTFTAVHNARKLGVNLAKTDKIILSHGHYDHTGGLKSVLNEIDDEIEIIAHPHIFENKVVLDGNGNKRLAGIPYAKNELEHWGVKFTLSSQPVKITENIILSGEIPMVTNFEIIDHKLCVENEKGIEQDQLLDDQAIFIKTARGLLVVLGCAHRGMINTIKYGMNLTGEKRLFGVMGGSHLVAADEIQTKKTAEALLEYQPQYIGLCHCTGMKAAQFIKNSFPNVCSYNYCGSMHIFDSN